MEFNLENNVESLYIHWPFCPYKCNFCPFVAIAGHDEYKGVYHNALLKELKTFFKNRKIKSKMKTVFFGGGTPSTYPEHLLLDTCSTLYNEGLDAQAEISIEVNPGTVNVEKLKIWKEVGINRLSIGVQSRNDAVLKSLNRHQKFSDVLTLLDSAQNYFDNLSIDLIIGLPGVSDTEWKELILDIKNWPIKHISLYFLTVHEDTPLYFGLKKNKFILPAEDQVVDLYFWTIEQLASFGLKQYEISNFAVQNYESRHNSIYWKRKPYKGLGLGACSFDGNSRFQNEKNLMKYIENIERGENITIFSETLSASQIWLEELMLGLRQTQGILLKQITSSLKDKEKETFLEQTAIFLKTGLMKLENEYISLTPAGLALANEIVLKLSVI